jgi:hypothetical protein
VNVPDDVGTGWLPPVLLLSVEVPGDLVDDLATDMRDTVNS